MKKKQTLPPEERDFRRSVIAMISVSIAALAALFFFVLHEEPLPVPSTEAAEFWRCLLFLGVALPGSVLLFG